jgi:hypothetical protein
MRNVLKKTGIVFPGVLCVGLLLKIGVHSMDIPQIEQCAGIVDDQVIITGAGVDENSCTLAYFDELDKSATQRQKATSELNRLDDGFKFLTFANAKNMAQINLNPKIKEALEISISEICKLMCRFDPKSAEKIVLDMCVQDGLIWLKMP